MLFISSLLSLRHSLLLHGSWIAYMRIFPQIPPILQFISPRKFYARLPFSTHNISIFGLCRANHRNPLASPPYLFTTRRQPHGDSHQCYSPGSPIFSTVPLRRRHPRGINYPRFPMGSTPSQSTLSFTGSLYAS
jgi:hypothetical protein